MNNNLDENKQYKTNTNMNKKLIRLTEQDLHKGGNSMAVAPPLICMVENGLFNHL